MYITLIPAYGRDYKSKKAIIADLDNNLDFILASSGQYINKSQLIEANMLNINVRYSRLTKIAVLKLC